MIHSGNAMDLVLVEWEDSHGDGAWHPIGDEIADRALVCRSVGWLVLHGKNAVVIAPHINEQEPGVPLQGCGVMTIPARAVLSIQYLAHCIADAKQPAMSDEQ